MFCKIRAYKQRTLGECLLISSLRGKAFRTLVDIARLAERFNMRSQSRAWQNWYQNTRTWYSIYHITSWFTLQTSDNDIFIDFCVASMSMTTSYKKCNVIMTWWRHMPWDRLCLSGQRETMHLIWEVTDNIFYISVLYHNIFCDDVT